MDGRPTVSGRCATASGLALIAAAKPLRMTHAHRCPNQQFPLHITPEIEMQPPQPPDYSAPVKGDSPRELRNKAEKERRDKMNQSIAQLAAIVPPVVATRRKMDKTSVLKLTAHYLRSHQYVFGESINPTQQFTASAIRAMLGLLKGFILTTTYKGIVVVVSQNVQQYLGFSELDLIGQNIFNIIHEDDQQMLRDQLTPKNGLLGPNGELLIPDQPDGTKIVDEALRNEKRHFIIRFKKFTQRSAPRQYVTCHVEGTFRRSDKACRTDGRCCQMVRRVRARGYNPCPGGNDVVFVGLVRPTCETFANDKALESFRMEYRTRHSIDGEIIECDSRIALVTGYMTHEVNGVNAMNFMHRDDVRWVIVALREMYDQRRLMGESCYRLMTKSGQFIYMQTKGYLDVDEHSRAVTSFVCTNTMVDEHVGKHLIKLMKKRFMLLIKNNEDSTIDDRDESLDINDSKSLTVEDPRLLEKVILHLVTNLPSTQTETPQLPYSAPGGTAPRRIDIIPHKKERIVNAIEKIYSVIKSFKKQPTYNMNPEDNSETPMQTSTASSESDSDSLSSLWNKTLDMSESVCPSLSWRKETSQLKRKLNDDDDKKVVKIRKTEESLDALAIAGPSTAAAAAAIAPVAAAVTTTTTTAAVTTVASTATVSTAFPLQSDNNIRATQQDNMWWPQEPGPSQQPSTSQAAQPLQPEDNVAEPTLEQMLQRLGAVQFDGYAQRCNSSRLYNHNSDSELFRIPQVPQARARTTTDSPWVTIENNSYDAIHLDTIQQYLDPAMHERQNNYCNNQPYTSTTESAPSLRGFSLSDDENYSNHSNAHYLTPNVLRTPQYDASSSSSYVVDATSGIPTLVPKVYYDNINYDNGFIDFYTPIPDSYDINGARLDDDSFDFLYEYEDLPSTSSANCPSTSNSYGTGDVQNEVQSAHSSSALARPENIHYASVTGISEALNSSIKEEVNMSEQVLANETVDTNEDDGGQSSNSGNDDAEDVSQESGEMINVDE